MDYYEIIFLALITSVVCFGGETTKCVTPASFITKKKKKRVLEMKNFWWVRIIFSGWLIYFVFSFCSKVFLVRQDTSEVCSIVSSCCNDISPTASKMKKKVIIYAHANSSSYYTSSSRQFSLSMTTFLYTSRCSPKSSITLQNFPY